ncbi:GntR family transcriptional regulator [Rhodobium gokarnense]|uniref:GntR family transcriptional regulator n=1 Tax=Rhodobium gokarnense TaxID=364296 RepID=A0ABT3H902_9HYPH|nr:GntR family transcriptional regulator [Rhodobium gokarnense]MCW2306883.1 GntR family transcriptional regulator [Rhodobium gokarnense]
MGEANAAEKKRQSRRAPARRRMAAPLYRQVMQTLRGEIMADAHGELGILPSESALIERFGVSRITVRRAIEELEREGLVIRSRGRATRIVQNSEPTVVDLTQEIEGLLAQGADMTVRVLEYRWQAPPPDVAEALDVSRRARTLWIRRLRSRQGQPVVHTSVHLPERLGELVTEEELSRHQLVDILRSRGQVAASAEQTMRAAPCPDELAPLLGLAPRSPIFILFRLVYGIDEKPMLMLRSSFRWDSFCYRMSLRQNAASETEFHAIAGPLEDVVPDGREGADAE